MEIRYKQLRAKIYFSAETDSFYGEVLEIPWLVSFQAKDLQEARFLMQEAIERYLPYIEANLLPTRLVSTESSPVPTSLERSTVLK